MRLFLGIDTQGKVSIPMNILFYTERNVEVLHLCLHTWLIQAVNTPAYAAEWTLPTSDQSENNVPARAPPPFTSLQQQQKWEEARVATAKTNTCQRESGASSVHILAQTTRGMPNVISVTTDKSVAHRSHTSSLFKHLKCVHPECHAEAEKKQVARTETASPPSCK